MDEITTPANCLNTGYTKRKQTVPKIMASLNTNVNRIRNINSAINEYQCKQNSKHQFSHQIIVRKLTGIKYHYTSAR